MPIGHQRTLGAVVVRKSAGHFPDFCRRKAAFKGVFVILPVDLPEFGKRQSRFSPFAFRWRSIRAKRGYFLVFLVFYFASLLRRWRVGIGFGSRVGGETYTLIFVIFTDGYYCHSCVGLCVNHLCGNQRG